MMVTLCSDQKIVGFTRWKLSVFNKQTKQVAHSSNPCKTRHTSKCAKSGMECSGLSDINSLLIITGDKL